MVERKKVLFVSEAVTLAHVVRPAVLASALDSSRYQVEFASDDRYGFCLEGRGFTTHRIHSKSPQAFLDVLSKGAPLYSYEELKDYVMEDRELLKSVRPDLVVGDFRLSLAVSAAVEGIPYASLVNAHWSPYSTQSRFPIPDLPPVRLFGSRVVGFFFHLVQESVFRQHAKALNRLRKEYGLEVLPDLRAAYTHGDRVLYLDVPELVPTGNLPANHRYIGPVQWAPKMDLPNWWDEQPTDRPLVYVTLGSSGKVDLLPAVLQTLGALPIYGLVATAGRKHIEEVPENMRVVDFLPGDLAARRADLVICNGGSATVYQALGEGTPVLGIASNMDQHLTMGCVEKAGAGVLLRSDEFEGGKFDHAVRRMLDEVQFGAAAERVKVWFLAYPAEALFTEVVADMLS
ncbi:MAG: glycosyltransferase [Chromatiales bacterium]|nr:glycosyltransferase [Chromatiales bacterium]